MFGLGMQEILIILALALIVIGPKKLPELAKTLGRAMGEFKRSAQDFKRSIDVEAAVNDLTDIETPSQDLRDAIKETAQKAEPDKKAAPKDGQYPSENKTDTQKDPSSDEDAQQSTQEVSNDNTDNK